MAFDLLVWAIPSVITGGLVNVFAESIARFLTRQEKVRKPHGADTYDGTMSVDGGLSLGRDSYVPGIELPAPKGYGTSVPASRSVREVRFALLLVAVGGALSAAVLTILAVYVFDFYGERAGFLQNLRPFGLWALYFSAMIFGMAGQYMWGLEKWEDFRIIEFVRPLWVAIIVFGIFWSAADVTTVNFPAVAAAYQNGFFWKIVLQQRKQELAKRPLNKRKRKPVKP